MKIMISLLMSILFIGCGSSSNSVNSDKYELLSVTDFSYTMGGKQSVSVSIGENQDNYFNITIHRNQIKNGVSITRYKTKDYNPETEWKTKVIDAESTINGVNYKFLLKGDLDSKIDFKINQLDYNKREALVNVYLKLVNIDTKKYIILEKKNLLIKDKMFDNFTLQINHRSK